MSNLFGNSVALNEIVPPPVRPFVHKDGSVKMLNYSKSSAGEDDEANEQPQDLGEKRRHEKMRQIVDLQKQGIIPQFDIDSKYLEGDLDRSVNFNTSEKKKLSLAERVAIFQNREAMKKLLDDSKLNDSRKYIMGTESPNFGL